MRTRESHLSQLAKEWEMFILQDNEKAREKEQREKEQKERSGTVLEDEISQKH